MDRQEFINIRDGVFRNPTAESALKLWRLSENPPPFHPSVPLASVHKARVQWLNSTDEMLRESKYWLFRHGYKIPIGALTPEQRDAERVMHGLIPLNGSRSNE